jgi:hypothetical protein
MARRHAIEPYGSAINPASMAPAFREMLPLLRKGEKVMLWVPRIDGSDEPVVYAIELVEVVSPRPVIADPPKAITTPMNDGATEIAATMARTEPTKGATAVSAASAAPIGTLTDPGTTRGHAR